MKIILKTTLLLVVVLLAAAGTAAYGDWDDGSTTDSAPWEEVLAGLTEAVDRAEASNAAHPAFIADLRDYLDQLWALGPQVDAEDKAEWGDYTGRDVRVDAGLIAHWRFDDAAEGTASDRSNQGHDGAARGVVPTTDWQGEPDRAYEFSAGRPIPHIDIGDPEALRGMAEFTLAAWVKPSEFASSTSVIISKHSQSSNGEWYLGVGASRGDTRIHFAHVCSENRRTNSYFDHDIPTGQWMHIAVRFDNGRVAAYADGRLVGTNEVGTGTRATDNPVYIGAIGGASFNRSWDFRGALADVRAYDRALTSDEIRDLL